MEVDNNGGSFEESDNNNNASNSLTVGGGEDGEEDNDDSLDRQISKQTAIIAAKRKALELEELRLSAKRKTAVER